MAACSLVEASSSMTFGLFGAGNWMFGRPESRNGSCSISVPSTIVFHLSTASACILRPLLVDLGLLSLLTYLSLGFLTSMVVSMSVFKSWTR